MLDVAVYISWNQFVGWSAFRLLLDSADERQGRYEATLSADCVAHRHTAWLFVPPPSSLLLNTAVGKSLFNITAKTPTENQLITHHLLLISYSSPTHPLLNY